jgi:hypothetical protein
VQAEKLLQYNGKNHFLPWLVAVVLLSQKLIAERKCSKTGLWSCLCLSCCKLQRKRYQL